MAVTLYKKGLTHARSLVSTGKVNKSAEWSFSAEDGTALLGPNGDKWDVYGSFHLGEDTSAAEDTKERFKYPFGKGGEVYRSGLTAIRQRAGQQNETEIFDAAGELIDSIDGKGNVAAKRWFIGSLALPQDLNPQAKVPTEIQLLPLGTWRGYIDPTDGQKKTFTITPREVAQAVQAFKTLRQRNPELDLVIDNDHRTLIQGEYAPAFGWIKNLIDAGEGGLRVVVEWTELGATNLAKKLYKYISPVFFWDAVDGVTGQKIPFMIHSAGLTNTPFIEQLDAVVAKKIIQLNLSEESTMNKLIEKIRAAFQLAADATEEQMISKLDTHLTLSQQMVAAKKEIFGALGLAETATTEDAKAKITASAVFVTAKKELFTALELPETASLEEAKAKIVLAKGSGTSVQQLQQQLNAVTERETTREFTRVIAKATQEGRVLPAQANDANWMKIQKDWAAKDFAGFEGYFAKAPVVGPITLAPMGSGAQGSGITDVDREIMKNLNVKEEQFKKYNTVN